MRLYSSFLLLSLSLSLCLAACAHERPANQSHVVSVSQATYAVSTPAAQPAMTPSSECAEGYNDIVTHLERLMAQHHQKSVSGQ